MIRKLKQWKTRTRIKLYVIISVFMGALAILCFIGWFKGLQNAPEMLGVILGERTFTGLALWISIAWENRKVKAPE